MAAIDLFLKLDGIPGESTDFRHKGEIVLESFSWGETNAGTHVAPTGGAAAGKVSMQDFHFTSRVSKASPLLMLSCANGQHIKTGVVTVRKAGGGIGGKLRFVRVPVLEIFGSHHHLVSRGG